MKKLVLLAFAALGCGFAAQASHLMGGQITVHHDTLSQYTITMTVYRDQLGVPMDTTSNTFHITEATSGFDTTIPATFLSFDTLSGSTVTYGVEEYTFQTSINLPVAGHYNIGWYNCCRNAAIINVTGGASGNGMYLNTDFEVFAAASNSTPVFLNQPIAFVPLMTAWSYNPLPYDADGDSLVWYIDTIQDQDPISTGGVNIHNWYQPSSDTSGVFTVNPLTGEITWTPDAVGNWVASFVVDESPSL